MIICITGWFDIYDRQGYKTGKKEFVVSHGVDTDNNDKIVVIPNEHPRDLGAIFSEDIGEWVIY